MAKLNCYELGMGSDQKKIEAPSADVAVFFYFTHCVNANVPLVVVYTENGQAYTGDAWWIAYSLGKPVDDWFKKRCTEIVPLLDQCRVITEGETEIPFDELVDPSGV